MIAVALRGLWGRKLRATLTAFAIVLGVATVTGTYILTDSISNAFDSIFTGIYRGTDAAITGRSAITSSTSNTELPAFDESLLEKVRQVPDVAAAVGGVGGEAQLIGRNGKVIAFGGAPNLGFSVDPSQPQFNSLTLVDGDWPGSSEVVVDRSTAGKKDIKVGSMLRVEAQGRALPFRVSGLVNFGAASSIGGATLAGFDLPTAQRLFKKAGKLDQIRVASKPGVSEQELVSQIRKILPPQTQVRTGEAQAASDASDTKSFLSFLQTFLLAFGGIALFVGAFVIANSISITVAQRTREFATLRTIGASRRQVRVSVLVEATITGILASVVGVILGLGLAKGLFWLFDSLGFTLPNSGLLLKPRTVIVALARGSRGHDPGQPAPRLPGDARAANRGRARRRRIAARALCPLPRGWLGHARRARLRGARLRALLRRSLHQGCPHPHGPRDPADLLRRRPLLVPPRRADGARARGAGCTVRRRARASSRARTRSETRSGQARLLRH